ncbi:signal recognition particle-docking protein FtsY [Neptunomonas sp.]|uniref:signal recognition particle-docking protein FtsY n=1 Tax=Neptunomonas sp. TaxID=1971898 RepID=UPI0035650A18
MFKKLRSIFSSSEESQEKAPEVVEQSQEKQESKPDDIKPVDSDVVEPDPVSLVPEVANNITPAKEEPSVDRVAETLEKDVVVVAPKPESETEAKAEAKQAAEIKPLDEEKPEPADEATLANEAKQAPAIAATSAAGEEPAKKGMFARMKAGLSRTKANLSEKLGNLFLGKKEIDDELLEDIETLLLTADVGVEATTEIIGRLTDRVARNQLADAQALHQSLKQELAALLGQVEQPLVIDTQCKPYVILMVGVNGVGKTTTIGKLTKRFQAEGKSVMLAAGDTFRAAAVEQLQVWGQRNNVPVIAQHTGADSASVLFDALQSAQTKNVDVLIADTAGRLQNKDHLMQELEKVVRVMRKKDMSAPHEVMLVLDAGTGQNAMSQARIFKDAVGVTGITLTKLDGTAKGGIIFAIAKQLQLPIRYIGVGEQIDDLRPFVAEEFVAALFD